MIQTEKAMAPHSSTLAWKIPWTEESGGLQSMGSQRVGHDWATSLSCIGEENGNPLQCSCLENPRDVGAWWAAVYVVAQSRTRLKRLSSSSRSDTNPTPSNLPKEIRSLKSIFFLVRSFSACFSIYIPESQLNFIPTSDQGCYIIQNTSAHSRP